MSTQTRVRRPDRQTQTPKDGIPVEPEVVDDLIDLSTVPCNPEAVLSRGTTNEQQKSGGSSLLDEPLNEESLLKGIGYQPLIPIPEVHGQPDKGDHADVQDPPLPIPNVDPLDPLGLLKLAWDWEATRGPKLKKEKKTLYYYI